MVKTIQFKGASCSYRIKGKGKTVMLVHGFMEEGSLWKKLMKTMEGEYQFIVPDLPGFGQSEMISAVSMEEYAAYLKAICSAEKVKSFILLGHSMGGYVALAFAEKYARMLVGLGLLNSHCYADAPAKKANRRKTIAFIEKHGTEPFVKEFYANIFDESYKKKHPAVIKAIAKTAMKYEAQDVIAVTKAMMNRKDKSSVLQNTKVPVLLINGLKDEVVPADLALKQASLPKVCDFHLFDKSKHMSMFEKKKETVKAIRDFAELC
jgi:pimeloyl-ACP methyl ester carboxylesterase